jgi:trehalose-6-phosphate synthase
MCLNDFIQVILPPHSDAKEFSDLKEELDQLIEVVNAKFSTSAWSPVRCIHGRVPQVCNGGQFLLQELGPGG